MINYEEINDFINKVFNYYNSRINIINKAVLDINWCNLLTCQAAGYSRLPNIVTINPMVIIRFFNNDEIYIKLNIVETIIHELYHTDQLINYQLYASDKNYNTFIENACEVQTHIYINGHLNEIGSLFFGNKLYLTNRDQYNILMNRLDVPGIKYQRRYFYDHIFMCVDDICNLEDKNIALKIYDFIKRNIINKNTTILNINNEEINICNNNELIDINRFNQIMLKYVCTGIHNTKHYVNFNKDTNVLIINIETEVVNLMCKKV